MKNLGNYGVHEMNTMEKKITNGGGETDPDGCAGCSDGAALRNWLGNVWDSFVDSYASGGTHTQYGI